MNLSDLALSKIDTQTIRLKLALALTCSERTIVNLIAKKSDDLTKAAALKVIREETGLTDAQILEETAEQILK